MVSSEAPTLLASPAKDLNRRECPICGTPDPFDWMTAPDWFHGRPKRYQLLRCKACSMVWLDSPPSKSEMGTQYGADYDRTISSAAKHPEHWCGRRDELRLLKPGGGAVLDLGCASGGFLSALAGPSWKLSGIEMSEDAAALARSRCAAEVFVGDILDAPFPPASFDAITAFNVVEHVYEPKEVLARVAQWLKPGGVFYTMIPNIDSAGARLFRSYWYALELPRHLYHFSPATLKMLAKSAGLQEVSVTSHRELYFESSFRYVVDHFLHTIGIRRQPLARAREPIFPVKVVRKLFRISVLPLITASASFAGDGETITAVFTKGGASHESSV